MIINSETVRDFVESNPNLVYRKETSFPGVYLLKYKNRVFYDNLWDTNPILRECRGTLVDANYKVISRPFTKIFNYGENGTTIDDNLYCVAYKKVNGFMAALSMDKDCLIVSTTGSTDSRFVSMALEMLVKYCDGYNITNFLGNTRTVIVEIVHPDDPHIIPEEEGVYLLGARWNTWDAAPNVFIGDHSYYEYTAKSFGMKYCDHVEAIFSDIRTLAKYANHEGYVVYSQATQEALKIKSPFYLMSKFLARKHTEKLVELFEDQRQLRSIIDEEYYPLLEYIKKDFDTFLKSNEQDRLNIIRNYIYG